MKQGFIKLSRKFFETSLWKEPRTYSRSEAWLDMIQMAGFEDSTQILNNREIEVRRGEIVASRRFLEKRWQWGSTKVTNFLDYLRSNRMINQRQTNGQTIITLCNYDIYNDAQTSPQTENKPPTNHPQTTGKPPTNQNKEYKEYTTSSSPLYIPPVGEIPLVEMKSHVLSCEQAWLDAIGMNRHLVPEKVKEWLDKFFSELIMNGIEKKELKDFKHHFNNWLKIQLEHENSGNRKNTGNSKALREKDTFAQKDYSGGF